MESRRAHHQNHRFGRREESRPNDYYCRSAGRPMLSFFFFQAEDGIRYDLVTGVQTCALPISNGPKLTRIRDRSSGRVFKINVGTAKRRGASCSLLNQFICADSYLFVDLLQCSETPTDYGIVSLSELPSIATSVRFFQALLISSGMSGILTNRLIKEPPQPTKRCSGQDPR